SLAQEAQHFAGTGLRQPLGRRFEERADLGRGKLGQPDEDGLERGGAQLTHQLAQVFLARWRGCFVDGLENLSQDARLAEPGHERIEPLPLVLLELLVSPDDEPGLPQYAGNRLEIAQAQDMRQVSLECREHVSPSPVLLALFEDVEQDRDDVGPQILLILPGNRVAYPADLGFVEPV